MAKTKTSTAAKRRYNEKVYARLNITIPKNKKGRLEEFAKTHGGSVNGLINQLLREAMGISEREWKDYLKDANNLDEG